jgi:hypothetical protein
MKNIIRSALVAIAVCGAVRAQATHVVGVPGSFAEIADAVQAASPGDYIDVHPGLYESFDVSIGVTLRSVQPYGARIDITGPGMQFSPPSGQVVHVVGFDFDYRVRATSGRVTFEHCDFSSHGIALEATNTTVHLIGCDLRSLFSIVSGSAFYALTATNSDITAIDSTFSTYVGDRGIHASNCRLHLSHCEVSSVPIAFEAADSTVWLSDSSVIGNTNPFIPQVSPFVLTSTELHLARVAQFPVSTALADNASLLSVSQPSPLRLAHPFTLNYTTDPNEFVIVFACTGLGTASWGPFLMQPSWLDDTQSFSAALLATDAQGEAPVSWLLPADPALINATLWFMGVSGMSLPLQVSPVAGGVAR